MSQGQDGDLVDIRYFIEGSPVHFVRDNEPLNDLNENILKIDDKCFNPVTGLKKSIEDAEASLAAHIGLGGVSQHAVVTTAVAGFMSAADKQKLDKIQEEAQVNVLSPMDALALISHDIINLHEHRNVTAYKSGFMSVVQKTKLDGIQAGAQVNVLTSEQATALTSYSITDLHSHVGTGITVQDEGTPLSASGTTLNFTGAGVTASGSGATKTISIPGGGGSAYVFSWATEKDKFPGYKMWCWLRLAAASEVAVRTAFKIGAGFNPAYSAVHGVKGSADVVGARTYDLEGNFVWESLDYVHQGTGAVLIEYIVDVTANLVLFGEMGNCLNIYKNESLQPGMPLYYTTPDGQGRFSYTVSVAAGDKVSLLFLDNRGVFGCNVLSAPFGQTTGWRGVPTS